MHSFNPILALALDLCWSCGMSSMRGASLDYTRRLISLPTYNYLQGFENIGGGVGSALSRAERPGTFRTFLSSYCALMGRNMLQMGSVWKVGLRRSRSVEYRGPGQLTFPPALGGQRLSGQLISPLCALIGKLSASWQGILLWVCLRKAGSVTTSNSFRRTFSGSDPENWA